MTLALPERMVVEAGGLSLHGFVWGYPDAIPVLLLHGSNGYAHLWHDIAARLAERHRVVAPDLRGHGDSGRPVPPSYRLIDYAADVTALAEALALPPFVLVGHSLGALVTMWLAGEGRLPLRAVAVLDIEACPPAYQAQHLNAAGARPQRRFATMAEVIAFERRSLPAVPEDRLERIARHGVRTLPDGTLAHKADREALRRFEQVDLRRLLGQIGCPALVMRGATSTVMRHEVAEAMTATLPRGRFVEIPGAGHQLIVEQPDAVAAALLDWLGEVATAGS